MRVGDIGNDTGSVNFSTIANGDTFYVNDHAVPSNWYEKGYSVALPALNAVRLTDGAFVHFNPTDQVHPKELIAEEYCA